ncbi:hypothetical protein [Delftia tsuruhatensis]|uniref:hypothetical protein n=1 Tax=Delftia tsuruhatensis TaxID=180282 RepID=UPI0023DBE31F|nr:hypothetical protein [Delftia tsuruhatensis]WEM01030.1 hypothetical protein PW274_12330 [Delftia tsuruhatensis]
MPASFHLLGSLQLPAGMLWVDEFDWSAVAKSFERSITGALVIDAVPMVAGRPITLEASEDQGWIHRQTLLDLHALADRAGEEHDLVLADGRAFRVQFAEGAPIKAQPVGRPEKPAPSNPYVATLRLITV